LIFNRTTGVDHIHENSSTNIKYIGHNIFSHRNLLIGGDYAVNPAQELTVATLVGAGSGEYIADNTMTQTSNRMNGGITDNNLVLEPSPQAQIGMLIPVENRDTVEVIGDAVSLSLRCAWISGEIHNIRMAILSWHGAADEIDTSVVNYWEETPVLSNGWTYENEPSDLTFQELGQYETFKIENIKLDSGTIKNIAFFMWTPSVIARSSFNQLAISNVRCNKGFYVEDFSSRHFVKELYLVRRYYNKSYDLETLAGTVTNVSSLTAVKGIVAISEQLRFVDMNINLTAMLKTPTIIPYAPVSGEPQHVQHYPHHTIPAFGEFQGTAGAQIGINTFYFNTTLFYHWVAKARF